MCVGLSAPRLLVHVTMSFTIISSNVPAEDEEVRVSQALELYAGSQPPVAGQLLVTTRLVDSTV